MKTIYVGVCLLALSTMTFVACKKSTSSSSTPTAKTSPLYQRLGGHNGIDSVFTDFIPVVAVTDTVTAPYFAITALSQERVDDLKMNLINLLGQAVGGPEVYTGYSMKAAHVGMHITQKAFNALVADLVGVLQKHNVSSDDINTIGSVLVPMQTDIVGH